MHSQHIAAHAEGPERRAPRKKAYLKARLSFAEGILSMNCVVSQISSTGARLSLDGEPSLPDRFQVSIPQRDIDDEVRLVWRRGSHAGIAFHNPLADEPQSLSYYQSRVRALEAEIKGLRSTIGSLAARLKVDDDSFDPPRRRSGLRRFRLRHLVHEPAEEIVAVARARRGLGVVLNREGRAVGQRDAAIRAVEQRDMGDARIGGQRGRVDRETVVHRNDLDLVRGVIHHRVVRAMVALRHLQRAGAEARPSI